MPTNLYGFCAPTVTPTFYKEMVVSYLQSIFYIDFTKCYNLSLIQIAVLQPLRITFVSNSYGSADFASLTTA